MNNYFFLTILFCIVLGRQPFNAADRKYTNFLRHVVLLDSKQDGAYDRDDLLMQALRSAVSNGTLSLYEVGTSIEDVPIVAFRFCLNSTMYDPFKTSVRFVAGIHGNDQVTVEYMLNLVAALAIANTSHADLYLDDLTIELLNTIRNLDIWIITALNPDGFENGRLGNEEGYDINRDFPSVFLDSYLTAMHRRVQPETLAYITLTRQAQFALGLDFFAGATVVSYPFHGNSIFMSGFNTPTPDDALFRKMAYLYASSNAAMVTPKWFHNGTINGAEWFAIYRTPADWSYTYTGTPVLSVYTNKEKALDNATFNSTWRAQVNSLIDLLSYVNKTGVRGYVYPDDATKTLPDRVYVEVVPLIGEVSPVRTFECDVYAAQQTKKSLHRTYSPISLDQKPPILIDNLTSGFSVLLESGYYVFRTYCNYGYHTCNFYSTCSVVHVPPNQVSPIYLNVSMVYLDDLDIVTFTPSLGPIGTILTVNGTDFTTTYNVSINGTAATIQSHILNELVCTVQPGTNTGLLFVRTDNGNYTAVSVFTVTTISFVPTFGPVGTHVAFTGMDFRSTTSCAFNGVNATIIVANTTRLIVAVKAGTTTGTAHIITSSVGSFYTNASFNVTTITFTPASGTNGTVITVLGADFSENSPTVAINGTAAVVLTHISGNLSCFVGAGTALGAYPLVIATPSYGTYTTTASFTVHA